MIVYIVKVGYDYEGYINFSVTFNEENAKDIEKNCVASRAYDSVYIEEHEVNEEV